MRKLEAQFLSGPFKKWCESKDNKLPSFVFEAKTTRGKDSLLFSQVEPHQIIALHQAKHSVKYYKIADDSRGTKPFDGAFWRGTDSYIVIEYPSFCRVVRTHNDKHVVHIIDFTCTKEEAVANLWLELHA